MPLRRNRIQLTVAIAALGFVLLLIPLLRWQSSRTAAIRADFDAALLWETNQVQAGWIAEDLPPDHAAWFVNTADGWSEPIDPEQTLEPPLLSWVGDSGGDGTFRDYSVDGSSYRAFVRPIGEAEGFVVIQHTGWRDELVGDVRRDVTLWLVLGAGAIIGCAWWLSKWALAPAAAALRERRDFLADAAHELRTPLAVIQASSSQALARPRPTEEYVRSLAEIRAASERASAGVNELLELARLDSGQTLPRLSPVRLDLLAEEVAASVRAERCEVVADPTDAVIVNADMPLLRQALDNVVRNAARRSTRVELTTRRDGRDGVVAVADDGPGFDPSIVDAVFDRYRRGDRNGEVGLGLSIVRSIVAAHGGAVSARNGDGPPPAGAVIEIRIPAAP